jgi:hypothetical protein
MPNDAGATLSAVSATEETHDLDFKSGFDPKQAGDWCELVKDVISMANSGGGTIIIGANDDGSASGYDASIFRAIDPADIANKINKYTDQNFADIHIQDAAISGKTVAVLIIGAVRFPIVFSAPGDYESPPGKTKNAFRKGTIYFRHGAKSEPGTTEDLRHALERELARIKDFWLEGITKVVEAPEGSEIHVVEAAVAISKADGAQPVRLTNSGQGPEFRVVDNDQVYPYRAKELMRKLAELLGDKIATTYDLQVVRKIFDIDRNPNFSHKSKFGTRQYSDAFVEWVLDQFRQDNQFFQKAREAARSREPL